MPFARGFKTRCENIAQSVRVDLGLGASDPLPASELATYLGVEVITPQDIPWDVRRLTGGASRRRVPRLVRPHGV